jgi:hypothetical protein
LLRHTQVTKLKEARNTKCSQLEDAEEDMRFSPASPQAATSSSGMARGRSDSATSNGSYSALRWDPHQAAQAAQHASTAASNLARSFTQRVKIPPTAHAVKSRFERMRLEAKERELASRGKDTTAILEKEDLLDEEGNALDNADKKTIAESGLQPPVELKDSGKIQIDQLEIAGITKHPKDWSIIFAKAKTSVPTTA